MSPTTGAGDWLRGEDRFQEVEPGLGSRSSRLRDVVTSSRSKLKAVAWMMEVSRRATEFAEQDDHVNLQDIEHHKYSLRFRSRALEVGYEKESRNGIVKPHRALFSLGLGCIFLLIALVSTWATDVVATSMVLLWGVFFPGLCVFLVLLLRPKYYVRRVHILVPTLLTVSFITVTIARVSLVLESVNDEGYHRAGTLSMFPHFWVLFVSQSTKTLFTLPISLMWTALLAVVNFASSEIRAFAEYTMGWICLLLATILVGYVFAFQHESVRRDLYLHRTLAERKEQLLEVKLREIKSTVHNILPEPISLRLMQGEKVIADSFDEVAVLFIEIRGLGSLAESDHPFATLRRMSKVFDTLDTLVTDHGAEKIKTNGGVYLITVGAPEPHKDPLGLAALLALSVLNSVTGREENSLTKLLSSPQFQSQAKEVSVRIGLHCGPVVAGVIGFKTLQYDVWGDTVNTASRLETSAPDNVINCSGIVYEKLKGRFKFGPRVCNQLKGKGEFTSYPLLSAQSQMSRKLKSRTKHPRHDPFSVLRRLSKANVIDLNATMPAASGDRHHSLRKELLHKTWSESMLVNRDHHHHHHDHPTDGHASTHHPQPDVLEHGVSRSEPDQLGLGEESNATQPTQEEEASGRPSSSEIGSGGAHAHAAPATNHYGLPPPPPPPLLKSKSARLAQPGHDWHEAPPTPATPGALSVAPQFGDSTSHLVEVASNPADVHDNCTSDAAASGIASVPPLMFHSEGHHDHDQPHGLRHGEHHSEPPLHERSEPPDVGAAAAVVIPLESESDSDSDVDSDLALVTSNTTTSLADTLQRSRTWDIPHEDSTRLLLREFAKISVTDQPPVLVGGVDDIFRPEGQHFATLMDQFVQREPMSGWTEVHEMAFREEAATEFSRQHRALYLTGFLCFVVFGIVDVILEGDFSAYLLPMTQYAVAAPVFLLGLLVSTHRRYRDVHEYVPIIVNMVGTAVLCNQFIQSDGNSGFFYPAKVLIMCMYQSSWPVARAIKFALVSLLMSGFMGAILFARSDDHGVHLPVAVAMIVVFAFFGLLAQLLFIRAARARYLCTVRNRKHAAMLEREGKLVQNLLLSCMPEQVIPMVLRRQPGDLVADAYPKSSVLFCDIAGFTALSATMTAQDTVAMLSWLFEAFDEVASQLGLIKIKTLGDCFVCAAGVPTPRVDHASTMVRMGLLMQERVEDYNTIVKEHGACQHTQTHAHTHGDQGQQHGNKSHDHGHDGDGDIEEESLPEHPQIHFRFGIASGKVIGGVIGHAKWSFDIWGSTVTRANEMEATGIPDAVHIDQQTFQALQESGGLVQFKPEPYLPYIDPSGRQTPTWLVYPKSWSEESNSSHYLTPQEELLKFQQHQQQQQQQQQQHHHREAPRVQHMPEDSSIEPVIINVDAYPDKPKRKKGASKPHPQAPVQARSPSPPQPGKQGQTPASPGSTGGTGKDGDDGHGKGRALDADTTSTRNDKSDAQNALASRHQESPEHNE